MITTAMMNNRGSRDNRWNNGLLISTAPIPSHF